MTPEPAKIAQGLSEAQRRAVLGDRASISSRDAGLMRQAGVISISFFGQSLGAALTPLGLQVRDYLKERDE